MNNIKTTVFIHVLNEKELLPHWLNHHKNLFDHGVIIDYNSTDNTRIIIKNICPTWDIVEPTEAFGACINLIENLEQKYDGWKIALNVTEFLFIDDLKNFIIDFEKKYPDMNGIRTRGTIIVDTIDKPIMNDIPLILQYTNGYFEEDIVKYIDKNDTSDPGIWNNANEHISKTAKLIEMGVDGRSRLLHKCNTGKYLVGRHTTLHENIYPRNTNTSPESNLILLWFGFAPSSITKARYSKDTSQLLRLSKLNMCELIKCHGEISYDLRKDDRYSDMFNNLQNNYNKSLS